MLSTIHLGDQLFGTDSPFSSILQMYLLAQKAKKDNESLLWLFNGVLDSYHAKLYDRQVFSVSNLRQKRSVSMADVILYKKDVKEAMLAKV